MLNDYEINRVETKTYHPVVSVLRLIASALAVYCIILLAPQVMEQFYETRDYLIDESLKVRVVANSNTAADQQLKSEMVDNLTPIFNEIKQNELMQVSNDEALAKLSTYIEQNYSQHDVKITVGEHVIPPKFDFNYFYPQSLYNSVVVTIGSGRGDNFWCSIFPNVCEGPDKKEQKEEKASEDEEKPEVVFVLWEWFLSLFS